MAAPSAKGLQLMVVQAIIATITIIFTSHDGRYRCFGRLELVDRVTRLSSCLRSGAMERSKRITTHKPPKLGESVCGVCQG